MATAYLTQPLSRYRHHRVQAGANSWTHTMENRLSEVELDSHHGKPFLGG